MLNRLLSFFTQLFVLWVILGGVLAFFFPNYFIPLKPYMDFFFAITMFGVGIVLKIDDFINIFKNYKIVIIGVVSQFSIMPTLGFLLATLFAFSDDVKLGLILTGAAPGAMASNVLSYLAGADVAYSVSLTTSSTILAPIMTPVVTLIFAHTILKIPFWEMFWSVTLMVVIPLFLGLMVRRFFAQKIEPMIKLFPAMSTLFIVFICSLVIALNRNYLLQMNSWIFIAVLLLNILGLAAGFGVARFFRFDRLRKRALAIEIGMQNAGLGSVLALKHFNERVALPAAIFVFICIFTAAILVQIWSKDRTG
ncbi:bile acid:sodium symporter family protein [candidate division KSB1 bacterium]|nr:bile acid:sodium symporter family protein [candidate division KSB1 bacterium]